MGSRRVIEKGVGLVLVLVGMAWVGKTEAQPGCTSAIIGLAPCLSYITGNSSTPSSSCCSQLGSVVQSSPQCLCSVLNGGGAALGISINQTLALSLPGACKVQTPPVSQCNAANRPTTSSSAPSPVDAPTSSPAGSSNKTPEAAITPSASDVPSGTGSKTYGGSSDGSIIKAPLCFVVFLLFVTSCASSLAKF